MKKFVIRLVGLIGIGIIALSACRPALPTPLPDLTIPVPTLDFSEFPQAARAAQESLAAELGLLPEDVIIEQVIPAIWSDSCLGLGTANESCLQVITSGYLVTLTAGGKSYEFRTDIEGRALRQVPASLEKPEAVDAAIQALADQLNTDPALISLIGFEPVDWPNSCLGIDTPGIACAEVITPGYRVSLTAKGQVYGIHTNLDGSQIAFAEDQSSQQDVSLITLKTEDPQKGCQEIHVSRQGAGSGSCGSSIALIPFPGMQRSVELEIWLGRYAPIDVSAADGSLTFSGRGTQVAQLEEQRALIAWTRLAAMDVTGEPADPPPGLLMDWRRTGGLAGVCNRLMIFESGMAYARDCKDAALGQTLLQTEQIKLIFNWRDNLESTLAAASEGVTDGFNYELQFNGVGDQAPSDSIKEAMFILAAQLYAVLVQ